MRRAVISTVVLVLLALVGFYGVWPMLSLQKVRTALKAGDEATLAQKIDFPAVRLSLKPVADAELDKALTQMEKSGLGGVLGGQFKDQLKTKLVDGLLQSLVTPERVIRMYAEGQDIRDLLAKFRSAAAGGEQGKIDAGKLLGDLFGKKSDTAAPTPAPQPAPAPSAPEAAKKPAYSLSNVKGFGPRGLTSFWFGVARDANAAKPEVVVDMAFTGGDWKIVGLTPQI